MFWEDTSPGLTVLIFIMLFFFLAPSAMGLGVHLMNKLVPSLAPTCDVKE